MVEDRINRFYNNIKKYGPGYFFRKLMDKFGLNKKNESRKYIEDYYINLTPEQREEELKEWFEEKVGYPLNLDHPKTFDEKIQWLKLYDSTPIKTELADKYLVRNWISEQIGERYLIPLLGVWDSFDEIDFSKLPEKFVLKANHGSTMNLIVTDKNKLDMTETKKKVDNWFEVNYGIGPAQEWQYLHTKKKVLAEKYIDMGGICPPDYKVYCFDGKPKYIQLIEGRFTESRMAFYDNNWNKMPFSYIYHGNIVSEPINNKKPKQLEEIIELSRKLSQDFAFVRVDWYLVGDSDIYFSEMTFTPAMGTQKWLPPETDEMLGNLIELPKEKYIIFTK